MKVRKIPVAPAMSSKRPIIIAPVNNVLILLLLKLKRYEQSTVVAISRGNDTTMIELVDYLAC